MSCAVPCYTTEHGYKDTKSKVLHSIYSYTNFTVMLL